MTGGEAGAFALEAFNVDPPTVKVQRHQLAAILLGPLIGQADHGPAVRVAAAKRVALAALRDELAKELRSSFAGDAGLIPSVASLVGRAVRLSWLRRKKLLELA